MLVAGGGENFSENTTRKAAVEKVGQSLERVRAGGAHIRTSSIGYKCGPLTSKKSS
jgi:hypothetical protein